MIDRVVKDAKVRASFWGLIVAVIVAASSGFIRDSEADKILETAWPVLVSVAAGLGIGWAQKAKQIEPPPGGGADHG